jgi:hypothetical protein
MVEIKCMKDMAEDDPSKIVYRISIETDDPEIEKLFPQKIVPEDQLIPTLDELLKALVKKGYDLMLSHLFAELPTHH